MLIVVTVLAVAIPDRVVIFVVHPVQFESMIRFVFDGSEFIEWESRDVEMGPLLLPAQSEQQGAVYWRFPTAFTRFVGGRVAVVICGLRFFCAPELESVVDAGVRVSQE
jgi:hypothetical protein